MNRQRVIFLVIIALSVVIAVGIFVASRYVEVPGGMPGGPQEEDVAITVVAAPGVYDWVNEAGVEFNEEHKHITVTVKETDGISMYEAFSGKGGGELPVAWIAEASFILNMTNADHQHLVKQGELAPRSIAYSPIVWGAFESRLTEIEGKFGPIGWNAVNMAAKESSSFKLIIPSPARNVEGLGALIIAAAEYRESPTIGFEDVSDPEFMEWLKTSLDSVPNFATLGAEPAATLAVRGPSTGDAGPMAESSWLTYMDALNSREPFLIRYPAYSLSLDYPFAIRSDAPESMQKAAATFRDYLLEGVRQQRAVSYSLRPAAPDVPLDSPGSPFAAWAGQGVSTSPPPGSIISFSHDVPLNLLRWAERERIGF